MFSERDEEPVYWLWACAWRCWIGPTGAANVGDSVVDAMVVTVEVMGRLS